jgi:hypothetical protein
MHQQTRFRTSDHARPAPWLVALARCSKWAKGMVVGAILVSLAACTAASSKVGPGGSDDPPRLDGYTGQYTLLAPVRTARLTPFRTAEGETIDLSHFRGKVVLLNFWATWCASPRHSRVGHALSQVSPYFT